jgi:serine/threonine protein kinase
MSDPKTVGSYKIVRLLGSGLMGAVYLATQQNQYWALRIIDERRLRTTSAVAKLVGDVLHPSLVRYKEIGADPQVGGFITTDYIEARPVTRDGLAGLRASARLGFITGLLEGLKVLHARGALHGAIKPSNVLLRRRKDQVDGLFIDAGFIYGTGGDRDADLLRHAYPYMAPELLDAYAKGERNAIERTLSVSCDVYAAALLVAEVLSGRPLFADARDTGELIARKRATTVEVTGVNDPLVHLDLVALNLILRAGTAADPAQRPATVAALIDGLRTALPRAAAA